MRHIGKILAYFASLSLLSSPSLAEEAVTMTHTPPKSVSLFNDTPGFSFIDENGKYYYHDANANYVPYSDNNSEHAWRFFSGKNYSDADAAFKKNSSSYDKIKAIYDPATVQNTVSLCENTPLMKEIKPKGSKNSEKFLFINYCDLMDLWVDPDTGHWYGLLHNEIFGIDPRYDAIDLVASTDKGRTWKVRSTLQTSQYGMPDSRDVQLGQTYNYGGGDPRLFADYSTGYFYMFYTSRVQNLWGAAKPGSGRQSGFNSFMQQHVMRAPIAEKMAPASWQKYHKGVWKPFSGSDLRLGNTDPVSNIVPVELDPKGYFTPEYSPEMKGSTYDMRARGELINSPLRVANVSWNSYLGKYVATPEHRSGGDDGDAAPLPFYATDNLSSQKWTKLGDLPQYANASWYRFMMDPEVQSISNFITGKTLRTFCYEDCTKYKGEYIDVTLGGQAEAPFSITIAPLRNADGETLYRDETNVLAVAAKGENPRDQGTWSFVDARDGYVRLAHSLGTDGRNVGYLGVLPAAAGAENHRRWGTEVALGVDACRGNKASDACLSTQWVVLPEKTASNGGAESGTGFYRLVNRFSGLALSFSAEKTPRKSVAIAPLRTWDCTEKSCLDPRKAASQRLAFR